MIVVPSRFAGLKIVEDDFMAEKIKATRKAEAPKLQLDKNKKVSTEKPKYKSNVPKNNQLKPVTSNNSSQISHSERKKKRKNSNNAQWEEWKQRDVENVDKSFQDDLMKAINLSTIEFNAEMNRIIKTETKSDTKEKECGKKIKKNKTLTLGQFAEMCQSENKEKDDIVQKPFYESSPSPPVINNINEFGFDVERSNSQGKKKPDKEVNVIKETKPKKEKQIERTPPSVDEIKQFQLSSTLEEKDKEIGQLKELIDKIEKELILVKTRNKKLCSIIGQGEMKAKASLLMEMEEVKEVHAELNSEVERLNAQLQQERSRCTCSNRQDKRIKREKKHLP